MPRTCKHLIAYKNTIKEYHTCYFLISSYIFNKTGIYTSKLYLIQTTEAEKSSVNQKKRIDELDAQLNETEEVIVNLRAELRNAHERLEEAKNSHMHQSNEPSENNHMDNSETTPLKNNPNINEKLYRNGYTHRIRAIENNVVDEKCISDDDKSAHEICRKRDEILTENSLRRSIRKRKVRCWDEISSLFKSRCKKYSNNDDVKSEEHWHKSKSLAEMSHISASTITNASEDEVVGSDSILSGCGNDKNRHLKYTFSRKRKKDLSCKIDNKNANLKEEASNDNTHNMVEVEVEVACQVSFHFYQHYYIYIIIVAINSNILFVSMQLISLSGAHSL